MLTIISRVKEQLPGGPPAPEVLADTQLSLAAKGLVFALVELLPKRKFSFEELCDCAPNTPKETFAVLMYLRERGYATFTRDDSTENAEPWEKGTFTVSDCSEYSDTAFETQRFKHRRKNVATH